MGDELALSLCLDDHDPNYDSEEQDEITYKTLKPVWTDDQVEETVVPIIKEYLDTTDAVEAIVDMSCLNIDGKKHLVVVCLLTVAMEMKNEFRELSSQLIKIFLTPGYILQDKRTKTWKEQARKKFEGSFMTRHNVRDGLTQLGQNLSELIVDTPNAAEVLGKFVARSIADKAVDEVVLDDISALDTL